MKSEWEIQRTHLRGNLVPYHLSLGCQEVELVIAKWRGPEEINFTNESRLRYWERCLIIITVLPRSRSSGNSLTWA